MLSPNDAQTEYLEQTFQDIDWSHRELISKEFIDCVFQGCTFLETVFTRCKFIHCTFKHCDLSLLRVPGTLFTNATFQDSKVIGVNWTEASWSGGKLARPLKFSNCAISHSTFIGLNLREITIRECVARNVDFREADLTQANLTGTDFTDSLFINTNLTKADLTRARNYHINATLNKIEKARFSLPEAIALLHGLDIVLVDQDLDTEAVP